MLLDGRNVDLAAPASAVPAADELRLDETWGFAVLPFPDDPEWHADMDHLELMAPEGGYPATLRSGSWTEQGLPYLSGTARYTQTFDLPEAMRGRRLLLDLGEVRIAARVYLNGRLIGDRAWAPYTFELAGLRPGANELAVEVSNTLANYIAIRHQGSPHRHWATFTADQLRSGLIGPVRIVAVPEVTLRG